MDHAPIIRTVLQILILAAGAAALLICCRRKPHVLIAGGVLLLSSSWWLFARDFLEWALVKEAVPWPAITRVDEDLRLLSLSDEFPVDSPLKNYVKLGHNGKTDEPDGEIIIQKDVMESLGIGTGFDRTRYKDRKSNWYVSRLYYDTREEKNNPYRVWQLDVTYYTGSMDVVPHIPEVCLFAAGLQPQPGGIVRFRVPSAEAPWNDAPFNRTPYLQTDRLGIKTHRFVQYYSFCLNGLPETSRERVRAKLTIPWIRHCYFAKIQFGPRGVVNDLAEADRRAEDFARHFLPSVLENLPTQADIEKLSGK